MAKPTRSKRVQAVLDWKLWGPGHSKPDWYIEHPAPGFEDAKFYTASQYSTAERPMMFLDSR